MPEYEKITVRENSYSGILHRECAHVFFSRYSFILGSLVH